MFDIVEKSTYGSSFVPLSKFVNSQQVADALNYWSTRWNILPQTLSEYKHFYDIDAVPLNQKITLFCKGRPYEVYINDNGEIEIAKKFLLKLLKN